MNSKKKLLSLCLVIALVATCVLGVLMFTASAEDAYTAEYAVGTDGDNVKAVLQTVASRSWAAGDSVKITFTEAQGQQTTYTQLSSGEYIGIAWDVPTIFRADGTKLPITIEGPSASTNLLVGYNNAKAYTVFTNDYTFYNLRFNSFNQGYVLAGSGNIVLNKVGFAGTPTYAADNITARAYAGWTAENFAANAIDGKAQSSMTMTNGTVYGNMMSNNIQKLFVSVAFNTSSLKSQAEADALTFLEADSYPLAPTVAETRAKLVLDYSGTYTINGNYFDLKSGYSPCECAFVMNRGTLANTSTAANTLRLNKQVNVADYGDYDVQILGGTLGGMRGAQDKVAHNGNVSFTFGEVGETGPTVNDALQFSWDGAVINGDANMTINSGTFKGAVYGPINLADKNGKFTINGGTFQAAVYGGMQTARHTDNIALNIEINGGDFAGAVTLTPSNNYNANVKNVAINYTLNGGTFAAGLPKIAKATNAGYTYTINNTVNTTVEEFCGFNGGIAATGTIHNTIGADAEITSFYGGASSAFAFTGNVTTDFIGGTVTNYYGGAAGNALVGNVTNNISGGTILGNAFGGSKAGTQTGNITNTITAGSFKNFYASGQVALSGDVVNNISGGTFNAFYGARVHADTITNTISGDATFNSYFYGAPMNGGIADIVVSTTVNGGTFKSAYYGGGYAESNIASITNTINGGEFKTTFNGGNKNGTSGVACPANITNVITGGSFTGVFYGGAEAGNGTGDITNTISGGSFATHVFGGSKAGSNSGDIENNISGTATIGGTFYGSHNVATAGDVVNNISGGTFSGNYYGLWHNADSVTNTISGGTFNGANFYAGQMNGATGAVNITNTITGGTFATGLYFYGGASDTTVGNVTTTLANVTINNYYGGNKNGGTVNNVTNMIKDGFVCNEFHGGSKAGEQAGTITNTVVGGTITTFFAGAEENTVANTVRNNVYGGTFVNYYIAGNQNGNADDVVISNIYGGSFARNFLVGARNVAETISTAPVVNFYTATSAVTETLATASNPITLNGPIVSDFNGRDALDGTNGVAHFFGGDKAILLGESVTLNVTSLSGNITFSAYQNWRAKNVYLTIPVALEAQVTVNALPGVGGSIVRSEKDGIVSWTGVQSLVGASLVFEDMISVRIYFDKDSIDLMDQWGYTLTGLATVSGGKSDLVAEGDYYYLTLPAVASSEFHKTFTLQTGGETRTFSILSLAKRGIDATYTGKTGMVIKLLKSLYNFGLAAKNEFDPDGAFTGTAYDSVAYQNNFASYAMNAADCISADQSVAFTGVSLDLGSAMGLRMYVKAPSAPAFIVDGKEISNTYYRITEIPAEEKASFGGADYCIIFNVRASSFLVPMTVQVKVGTQVATVTNVTIPAAANMNSTQADLVNAVLAYIEAICEYAGVTPAITATPITAGNVGNADPNYTYPAIGADDRLSQAKIDAIPLATEDMTVAQKRQIVVDFFQLSQNFNWTPNETSTLYAAEDDQRTLQKGTRYGGFPYLHNTTGNLYRWLEYYDPATGVVDTEAMQANPLVFSNQCNWGAAWGWLRVINSVNINWTANMVVSRGFLRVGPYTYDDSIDTFAYSTSTHNKGLPTTSDICEANGRQVMYQSYAQLQPGDALVYSDLDENGVCSNHVIMVKRVWGITRDSDGNIINGNVDFIDQYSVYRTVTANDGGSYKTESRDAYFRFDVLFNHPTTGNSYVPVTFREFLDPSDPRYSPVEEATAFISSLKAVDNTKNKILNQPEALAAAKITSAFITPEALAAGSITTNYTLSDVFVTVTDEAGNVYYKNVYRTSHDDIGRITPYSINLSKVIDTEALAPFANSSCYKINVTCQVSHGEVLTAYSGSLIAAN